MIAMPIQTKFVVPLTLEQFIKLRYQGVTQVFAWIKDCGFIPMREIEYDGHFGPNFFFAVDGEDALDVQAVADAVVEILKVKLA